MTGSAPTDTTTECLREKAIIECIKWSGHQPNRYEATLVFRNGLPPAAEKFIDGSWRNNIHPVRIIEASEYDEMIAALRAILDAYIEVGHGGCWNASDDTLAERACAALAKAEGRK